MAARSEGPLGCERVDGHPIVHLSLLDKAPLHKYSHSQPSGLSTRNYLRTVHNKRDGLSAADEGPHASEESVFAKQADGEATGTEVTEIHIVEPATEASVDEGLQSGSRNSRRFTGKATKTVTQGVVLNIKSEPVELDEAVVLGPSWKVLETRTRVAEILEPRNPLHDADQELIRKLGITDYVLLTLLHSVTDEALPHGFLADFVYLEQAVRRASDKNLRLATSIFDAEAELFLEADKRRLFATTLSTATAVDQLLVAADIKPRRFRSKWQQACCEGPTARKDAESAERLRWIVLLADLLRNTATPMGRLLRERPANSQLLGGGRRAGTFRSRVRVVQKFLSWLALAHNLAFPDHWRQLIEYMQVRLSRTELKV